ncbi:hypothetical protein MRB53_004039 [Persea americana]|uniref:Uncharacterized protein n=1 Tax=Persea americana TaxID=3435 RepID=A0ACC2MZA0_PERAE|nr:hypothetical protein MRB53_004039 [Persea americana]
MLLFIQALAWVSFKTLVSLSADLLFSRLTAGHHPHLGQHDLNDNAAMKKVDAGMESQAADLTAHQKKQRR